ncbi:hypothetical protein NC653_041795 [Populus alba x Populus x berolinensis]|uniref:Uncharacterized protein n=1 Tax=Populus alba x Populus x berolinensis TaxID=444605 RepID=A0AAD6L9H1_9ROSI|nr:hypothetical protein NC653_041795 [Populus alba x Populus x berolinensis]
MKRCHFQHCSSSLHPLEDRINKKQRQKYHGPRCQYPHPHDESPGERGSQKFLFPSCKMPLIVIPGDKLSAFSTQNRKRRGTGQREPGRI